MIMTIIFTLALWFVSASSSEVEIGSDGGFIEPTVDSDDVTRLIFPEELAA